MYSSVSMAMAVREGYLRPVTMAMPVYVEEQMRGRY